MAILQHYLAEFKVNPGSNSFLKDVRAKDKTYITIAGDTVYIYTPNNMEEFGTLTDPIAAVVTLDYAKDVLTCTEASDFNSRDAWMLKKKLEKEMVKNPTEVVIQ